MTRQANRFGRRACIGLVPALALGLAANSARAQTLTAEADQAFWCAAAYASYANKSAFASSEQQSAAMSDLMRFEPVMNAEAARLGWQPTDAEAMARSYYDEVAPQVDDYLMWKDPAALRLSLPDCFPSAGF